MSANPELLDDDLPSKRHKSSIFTERHLPLVVIYLMVATLIGFLLAPNIFVTYQAAT